MPNKVFDKVAGNGLISRRHLLEISAVGLGMAASNSVLGADSALKLEIPAWSKVPGPGAVARDR